MGAQQPTGTFRINLDGRELPEDVEHLLTSVLIDGNLNQPDLFVLSFRDPDRVVCTKTGAKIGSTVVITAFTPAAPGGDRLLSGDVTALEVNHDSTGTFTVLRGYDQSHRLFRGRSTEAYQNMTYADIAGKVAARAGLATGEVNPTKPVYPYVSQNNQNDWQFLRKLAADVGYDVLVDDGRLHFRPPAASNAGPGSGELTQTDDPYTLTMGAHLLRLRSVVTSSDQVAQVEVRGWDPTQKKAVTGTSPAASSSATIGVTPGVVAGVFGDQTLYGVGVPYTAQAEVDSAARAIADQIGASFAEVEGVARGNTKLRAGTLVSLSLVGDPFDGKYTLTSVRHRYDSEEGYTTAFTVSGKNQRSLLGLASGGPRGGGPAGGPEPVAGVVSGLVTDVNDPTRTGRVKVSFPWLSDSYSSDWARMVQIGAGAQRGAVFLPEVGDEVLVAFDHGDWRCPYVIGALYNGVDTPMLGDGLLDTTSGAVKRRGLVSKDGHALIFFDDPSDEGVALMTGDHNLRFSLNQGTTTVRITSNGQVKIDGKGEIAITSQAGITLEAQQTLSLKGQSVSISGDGGVSISSNADVSVSGQPIKLN